MIASNDKLFPHHKTFFWLIKHTIKFDQVKHDPVSAAVEKHVYGAKNREEMKKEGGTQTNFGSPARTVAKIDKLRSVWTSNEGNNSTKKRASDPEEAKAAKEGEVCTEQEKSR